MGTIEEEEDADEDDSAAESAEGASVRDRFRARRVVGVEFTTTLWAALGSSANVRVRLAIPGLCGTDRSATGHFTP